MGRGNESAEKRRLEARRDDRKADKAERLRSNRESHQSAAADDEASLMVQFHKLNEAHAAGHISEDAYELERSEIFAALGVDDPSAPMGDSDDR